MANYGFKTRNESPLQHEMGKRNAAQRKPSLSAHGQQAGVSPYGAKVTEPRPGAARREGRRAGRGPGAPAVSPSQDTTGQIGQCPQQEPGPGLWAAGTSLQRTDAWLPREGGGP